MDLGWILLIAVVFIIIWRFFMPVKGVENISAEQLEERMKETSGLEIIDVREPNEYKGGHISRAKNVPMSKLADQANKIPKNKPVALICRSGNRSMVAARRLKKMGYENLLNVRGGMMAWKGPLRK